MKKSFFVLALVFALVMSTTAAFANPVDLNGSVMYQVRHNTGATENDGSITKFVLGAKTQVAPNLSVYGRIAAEGVSQAGYADFNTGLYGGNYASGFDQFGINFASNGFDFKIGRQDLTLGTTAVLYNNNYKLGKNVFVDGVTVTGKAAGLGLKAVAVKEDNAGSNDNKVYAIAATKSIGDLTVGATIGRYVAATETSTHYALGAGLKVGKATLSGEIAKSNAATDNMAYVMGVDYQLTDKVKVSVTGFKVEDKADMNNNTDFWSNQKGVWTGASYAFDKTTSVNVGAWNLKTLDTGVKSTSFRATVSHSF